MHNDLHDHRVYFDVGDYVRSHGHKPRGEGLWAFFFGLDFDINKAFFVRGKFRDAKRAATQEARRRGFCQISVGP